MNKEEEDQTLRDVMDPIQESVLRLETGRVNQVEVVVQAEVAVKVQIEDTFPEGVVQVQITVEDLVTEIIEVIQEIDLRLEVTKVEDHQILPTGNHTMEGKADRQCGHRKLAKIMRNMTIICSHKNIMLVLKSSVRRR